MRNAGLDLLRFVAVFLVIGRHIVVYPYDANPVAHHITHFWLQGGWVGVDMFFVLSGFLVSGLLFSEYQKKGATNLLRFLIRRGFKIYPGFWVMLVFTIAVRLAVSLPMPASSLIGEITFTQNYVGALWPHTWSLAVEEHFYFGLALLIYLLSRSKRQDDLPFPMIPRLFFIAATACLALRILTPYTMKHISQWTIYYATHARIDSLMFGVFLSWHWHFKDLKRDAARMPLWVLLSAGVLLLSPAFWFPLEQTWWIPVFGFILFYLGSGFLVLAAMRLQKSTWAPLSLLVGLGSYSYSVYLWHMPLQKFGLPFIPMFIENPRYLHYLLIYVVGAFVIGYVFAKSIEFPMLKLRNRLFPAAGDPIEAKSAAK